MTLTESLQQSSTIISEGERRTPLRNEGSRPGTSHDRCSKAPFATDIAVTLVLFIVSLLRTGYRVFYAHQAMQIPIVHLWNDPSLFPGDPYRAALQHYPSLLWPVIAWASRVIPLESLLLSGFLLGRFLLIYAAGSLARAFAPGSRLAPIGAMALFVIPISPLLGGGAIVCDYFEQTGLAIPFLLLAITAFHRGRPVLWALWLGIVFNLQSMYGLFAVSYFGAVFLLDASYRRNWKRWLIGSLLFAALAAPAIVWSRLVLDHNPVDNPLWMAISHVRSRIHLYPATWPRLNFIKFGALLLVCVSLVWQQRQRFGVLARHTLIWSGVACLWLAYAFVVSWLATSPSLLILQSARATDLWICFAAIALTSVCADQVEKNVSDEKRKLWLLLFAGSFLLWQPMGGPFTVAIFLFAAGLQPTWKYLFCRGSVSRLGLLLVLWLSVGAAKGLQVRIANAKDFKSALISRPAPTVEGIASWANANSARNAVFLVDPRSEDWDLFRALSRRSVLTTFGEGGALHWYPHFVEEWDARMRTLGYDIRRQTDAELDRVYDRLDDARISAIKKEFRLDYWIVRIEHPSKYPVAFECEGFKVLALDDGLPPK